MKRRGAIGLVLCTLPILSGCGVEKEKLHGKWIVEDGTEAAPRGMVWEFASDGKLNWAYAAGGPFVTKEGLTWSVDADRLSFKLDGNEGRARIRELSDDRLVLRDDAQPKDVVFRRVR